MTLRIRRHFGLLIALVALSAVAVWRIDRDSLWVDEVFALASTNDLGLTLSRTKGTMGAYYVGLWGWSRFGSSTAWLRAFSVLGAAVTIVIVAAIARQVSARRVAWLPPLLVVGIPIFAWIAVEARAYTWECALVATCWLLVVRGVTAFERRDARETRIWCVLTVACLLGPLLHGLFILQVPGLVVVVAVALRSWRGAMRRVLPAFVAASVPTAAIYRAGGSNMGAVWARDTAGALDSLRIWFLSPITTVSVILGLALVSGVVAGALQLRSAAAPTDRMKTTLPVVWAVLPLAGGIMVLNIGGPFVPYYVAAAAGGIALLMAQGVSFGSGPTASRTTAAGAAAVVGVVTLVGVMAFGSITNPIAYREDWRGAARWVASQARPGDAIVFGADAGSWAGTASAYLGFTAAWRETPHDLAPRVISHDRQLDEPVLREVPYNDQPTTLENWSAADRVWVVDYHGVGQGSGLTDDASIRQAYCRSEARVFTPAITVALFEIQQVGAKCGDGWPTRLAGRRAGDR